MIKKITYTSDRDQFGSTDDEYLATVDVDASLEVLRERTVDALSSAYPDADVAYNWANVSPMSRIDAYHADGEPVERDDRDGLRMHDIIMAVWENWLAGDLVMLA